MFTRQNFVFVGIRKFTLDQSGVFGIIAALAFLPILLLIGGVIDYTIFMHEKVKLQTAMDSTTLALAHTYAKVAPHNQHKKLEVAKKYFAIAYPPSELAKLSDFKVQLSKNNKVLTTEVDAAVKTNFLYTIGIDKMTVHLKSSVQFPTNHIEVALALDNSTSMYATDVGHLNRLDLLKEAAHLFNRIMFSFSGEFTVAKPHIAIVPFGTAVNVGKKYQHAPWMDHRSLSPIHSENFDKKINRFTLYNKLGIDWEGCVEVRPQPYDIHDYDPLTSEMSSEDIALGTSRNARFFVPWFKPDEPDISISKSRILPFFKRFGGTVSRSRLDNYLFDNIPFQRQDASPQSDPVAITRWLQRLKNVNKYQKKYRRKHVLFQKGPNDGCSTTSLQKISDLSIKQNLIDKRIDSMTASSSMTNILEGVTWAWRVLTPGEPFTKGKTIGSKKYLILLSDGENTVASQLSNPNFSEYSAFGYASNNRLQIPQKIQQNTNTQIPYSLSANGRSRSEQLNNRTLLACKNIKNNGITLYTIAFGKTAYNSHTLNQMLSSCATSKYHYFSVKSDLKSVFLTIADNITQLHLNE